MSAAPATSLDDLRATRALVLAPHFDDELLGCGGLLLQLVRRGCRVEVLFLSDGGFDPGPEGRQDYVARRRQEARQVAEAAGWAWREAELPDGMLATSLPELRAAIDTALNELEPDLVLVPSPLEESEDHRATFAALYGILAPLRQDDPALSAWRDRRILAWEGNFPLRPNRLVEVGGDLPKLEELMGLYRSQQERRNYWGARQGLLQFRALTLDPAAGAAEAYYQLDVDDFRFHPLSALIEILQGKAAALAVTEGETISLIVRTRDRPQFLAEALASVAASSYRQLEVLVVNDGGALPELPADFPRPIRLLDLQPGRGRAGAANAGIAAAQGTAIAFLDDDDLIAPEHLAMLAATRAAAGVRVAYSDAAVGVYRLDGGAGWQEVERRLPYSRDFDPDLLLVDNYIPFHTLLIERELALEVGPLDETLPFFEDWDFLVRLAAVAPFHHVRQVTCEYRQFRGATHHILGDRPRERGDFLAMKARVLAKHLHRLTPELVGRAVDLLNAERVAAAEETAGVRRVQSELEDRFHRLNGQWAALRDHQLLLVDAEARAQADNAALREDQRARVAEAEELRAHVRRLDEQLTQAYAEIARLDALVKAMESSRAWRLHRLLQGGR